MNGKKARKLRKSLSMSKENLRQKDCVEIKPVKKVIYFRNKLGELTPKETTRTQVINKNLYIYRKMKKGV